MDGIVNIFGGKSFSNDVYDLILYLVLLSCG